MIKNKSVKFIVDNVKAGNIKAIDVAETFLSQAEKLDPLLRIFISFNKNKILEQAERVDRRRMQDKPLGKLAGVPVVIKDNILVKDERMTCASKILEDYVATYDATVVERIKQEDGIIFGKSNLDEFAMGSSTENSAFFTTKNPWDIERVPGGSSGGSAAAVASMVAPLALGSDTGGSVRQPASFCGIVGFKPTYGRVSRSGLVAFASSLDQIGPFSRDVESTAILMDVIAGYDFRDSTSAKVDKNFDLKANLKDIKIGVLNEKLLEGADSSVINNFKLTVEKFKELGCQISEIKLPSTLHAIEAYYIINPAEVSSNLARLDGLKYGLFSENVETIDDIYLSARTQGFGSEVKRRIMIGNYVLSSGQYENYFKKAYKVRRVLKDEFDNSFKKVDLILMPTSPTTAFEIGVNINDPLKMYLSDIFTTSSNLSGLPAISFPTGLHKGLPIGMQLIGRAFEENLIMSAVKAYEDSTKPLPYEEMQCMKPS